jgi:hypothetical protein
MPGCQVSAKRLSNDSGKFDTPRHNWKPLLRAENKQARHGDEPATNYQRGQMHNKATPPA